MGSMCLSVLVSSGYMPRSGIAGSYGGFIPSFLMNLHTIFYKWWYQFTFPQTVQKHSLFSTPFPAFIVCRSFEKATLTGGIPHLMTWGVGGWGQGRGEGRGSIGRGYVYTHTHTHTHTADSLCCTAETN